MQIQENSIHKRRWRVELEIEFASGYSRDSTERDVAL